MKLLREEAVLFRLLWLLLVILLLFRLFLSLDLFEVGRYSVTIPVRVITN